MWLILIGLVILFSACERPEAPAAARERAAVNADMQRSRAIYDRQLLFLAGTDTLLAAVLDFSAVVDSVVSRSARVWLGREGVWESFLEATWQAERMRDPWRLVPHGSLRLVVGDGDEVEALLYRQGERGWRLVLGSTRVEWSPAGGTQVRLRRAELGLGSESVSGTLLDVQAARELAAVKLDDATVADPMVGAGAAHAGTTITAAGPAPTSDGATATAAGAAATTAADEDAFLIGRDDLHLMLTSSPDADESAWLHRPDREQTIEGARLEWLQTEPFQAARRNVPVAWRIVTPLGALTGELRSIGHELMVLAEDAARPGVRGLYAVRGWIRVDGERHEVSGVVRHGQG